ncbi:hypothetical protein F2Q69_00034729 [Brassica cretica]|uniref:Uncharacterized protein n=1 Tax=Brassica cretica TaxID=69181 RepID=A0A8S9SJE4_BRACR|nr:hypothetical protein F2Q69_00034729 [Brassica cretica]
MSKKSSSVESIELELPTQTNHQFDLRSPISPSAISVVFHCTGHVLCFLLSFSKTEAELEANSAAAKSCFFTEALETDWSHVTCSDQSLVITSRTTASDSHNELTATGTNSREEEFDKNKLISCYKQQEETAHERWLIFRSSLQKAMTCYFQQLARHTRSQRETSGLQ